MFGHPRLAFHIGAVKAMLSENPNTQERNASGTTEDEPTEEILEPETVDSGDLDEEGVDEVESIDEAGGNEDGNYEDGGKEDEGDEVSEGAGEGGPVPSIAHVSFRGP